MTINTIPRNLVVVSPHLDDAALSAGALLADMALSDADVEVITLFAGVPPNNRLSNVARAFHSKCGLPTDPSAVVARREEDAAAMALLGVRHQHGDFLDAVYRTLDDGSWLCEKEFGMFGLALPPVDAFLEQLQGYIQQVCRRVHPAALLTCAGVGGHIDHILTRMATSAVAGQLDIPLYLWEDLPYGVEAGEFCPDRRGELVLHSASASAWARKWNAISHYTSQIRMLWGGADWQRLLAEHATRRGRARPAEALWQLRPSREAG